MASIKESIDIILNAENRTDAAFRSLSSNLKGVEGGMTSLLNVASPIAGITKNFLIMEGAIVAIGVAFGVHAYKESIKFEASQLDLQKVLADNEGLASDYTDQVDELALKFGISGATILQSAADFKQAGFDIKDSFLLTEAALTATRISELELGDASNLLVAILKGFKAPASEVTRLMDSMNEISNRYATSLSELAIGMAVLSPIARLMGFTFEETEGLLTPVIEIFRSGNEAATSLRTGLLKLIDDQKPVTDALLSIGVAQKDVNGHLRSGKDVLADVAVAFQTAEKNDKLFLATQLVGIRQASKMVEVFDGLAKTTEITGVAMNSAGSAMQELNIRLAAAETQVDRAKIGFEIMSRTIGDRFKVELTGVIGSVTDFTIALASITASGGFEPLMNIVRPQFEEWKKLIAGMAAALPEAMEKVDWSPLIDSIGNVSESLSGVFDGLDLTKPDDLAEAINKVIEVLGSMIDVTSGIIEVFISVGSVIGNVILWFSSLDEGTKKLVGSIGGASIAFTAFAPAILVTLTAIKSLAGAKGIGALIPVLGKVGLAGAVGAAAYSLTNMALEATGAKEKLMEFGGFLYDVIAGTDDTTHSLAELTDEVKEYNAKILAAGASTKKIAEVIAETGVSFEEVSGALEEYGDNFEIIDGKIKPIIEGAGKLDLINGKLTKTIGNQTTTWEEINGVWVETLTIHRDIAIAHEDTAEAIEETTKEILDYKLALEEIQSKERVTIFKLKTEVDIAEIESTTAKFEAMFDSINIGIESTGDLLSDLFGILGEGDFGITGWALLIEAIEKELELRQLEFELQKELVEAEIRLIDAKAAALERGDPMISITADGLEPELQAFMWQILKTIQVRANAEGQEFLLGI